MKQNNEMRIRTMGHSVAMTTVVMETAKGNPCLHPPTPQDTGNSRAKKLRPLRKGVFMC